MNNINLVGRLTKDPELKTKGDVKYCLFSLAVKRIGKKDETDFFNCTAFGKTAEVIAEYCKKGRELGVTGSIEFNKKDNVYYHSVKVMTASLIGSKKDAEETASDTSSTTTKAKEPSKPSSNDFDDDFPF